MIPCPKCGYDNELGRIFCHQCGTKLDLDQIKPVSRGGKSLKRKRPSRVVGNIVRLCGWLVTVALLVAIVMMLLVPEVATVPSTPDDLASFALKRGRLESAVERKRSFTATISESELNAFLDSLGFDKAKTPRSFVEPMDVQIQLSKDSVQVMVVARIRVGSMVEKKLLLSMTGKPAVRDGGFVIQPVAASIGRLPLPSVIVEKTAFVRSYFGRIFANLTEERKLLNRLSSIAVQPKQVVLEYQPPKSGP